MAQKKPMAQIPLQASVLYDYDFTRLSDQNIGATLLTLFNNSDYRELMTHRNRVFKGLIGMTAGQDRTGILKELDKIDRKVKDKIFMSLVDFDKQLSHVRSSRNVTLMQYAKDFLKTDEQRELYHQFTSKLDMSLFLGDLMESILMDAQEILKKLDPNCIVSEVEAIKRSVEPLHSYTSMRHKNEHSELLDVFCKYSEEVQDRLYPLCAMFVKEYIEKANELQAAGVLDKKCNEKKY